MGAPARSAGWWSDRSIRAKGLVVIAVPIVLLLAVLGSISWFTHVNDRAQSIGTEGRNALTVLDDLENNVSKADDAVRGYLLTGAPQYLSTYRSAISSAPGSLQELSSLSSEGLAHGATYHALDGTTKGLLADLVQLSSQMGAPSASPATQGLLRSSETDSARFSGAASELDEEINSSLTGLHSTIHSSSTDLLVITIAATVLALGGGIALSQLFTSGVTTRLRRLERATETLEQGGLPTDAPGGSDEIGRLSERLTVAASQLRDRATERDGARSQLEDILTASPVVSIRYDVASRRFSYASPNVSRLFGVTPEKVIEDPSIVIDRFHPEDAIRLRDLLVSASQRQGERVETLLRFRRDLSTEAWGDVEAVYTLERDPQGTLEGVVAYFVDASERHLAQRAADERRSMLESIFHASPDTIVVRDVEGHVVLASSSLAGLIGVADDVRRGAVLGPDVPVLGEVSLVDRKLLDSLTARCIAGEPTPDPVVTSSHLPGGETLTFETRARPVIDDSGHVTGTVTVSREITDRVRLEQSLRGASAAAARASEAKSEFLSRMSHELRTPLNAILGFAQLLELDDLPEDQQSSIDQIQRAGRHLLSLINEVLDISRIESGRLSLALEPVGVGDLLDEVTTLLAPAAEGAELQLTVGSGDQRGQYVHADR
ncbi:MAG TPA: histidine kinase dimerization/phospho-acceptor domain-containing protein, partial [Acidimicrobiales bacterium]|nr:histidine kinase dimerization/phospho-acceptor domain-containing protein [Acidimicrobiales bacterium]